MNVARMPVYDQRLRERLRDGEGGANVVRERGFQNGRVYWTEPHSSDVKGVARVERLGTVHPTDCSDLVEYVDGSLFDSAESWRNHIRKRHVWMCDTAYVFRLEADDDDADGSDLSGVSDFYDIQSF